MAIRKSPISFCKCPVCFACRNVSRSQIHYSQTELLRSSIASQDCRISGRAHSDLRFANTLTPTIRSLGMTHASRRAAHALRVKDHALSNSGLGRLGHVWNSRNASDDLSYAMQNDSWKWYEATQMSFIFNPSLRVPLRIREVPEL